MRRVYKRHMFFMAAAAALLLCGCGGSSKQNNDDAQDTTDVTDYAQDSLSETSQPAQEVQTPKVDERLTGIWRAGSATDDFRIYYTLKSNGTMEMVMNAAKTFDDDEYPLYMRYQVIFPGTWGVLEDKLVKKVNLGAARLNISALNYDVNGETYSLEQLQNAAGQDPEAYKRQLANNMLTDAKNVISQEMDENGNIVSLLSNVNGSGFTEKTPDGYTYTFVPSN